MIDALISAMDHFARVVAGWVGPAQLKALLLALLLSGFSTQFLKNIPAVAHAYRRKLIAQTWAAVTACAVVMVMYPAPVGERLITALCAGFGSPVLYWLTVRLFELQWPGLRENMSPGKGGKDDATTH